MSASIGVAEDVHNKPMQVPADSARYKIAIVAKGEKQIGMFGAPC
jgi:hypothetical protein